MAQILFGWSGTDILQLISLANRVYHYYLEAPESIKQSLERSHDVYQQLVDLSDILQRTSWEKYVDAPKLGEELKKVEDDLKEAATFYQRYETLANAPKKFSPARLGSTAKLGLGSDRDKVAALDHRFRNHVEKLSRFRQQIIL